MSTLNLTRKFRILAFEEIVGQQLIIRMLKNSLYTDRLFPVYLFFGQHGCGKTSIARIFGMAINCKSLPLFKKMPKQEIVPCLKCDSCVAMQKNNHPDFIEIDAASYTGVDNIRAIIESASYLPVVGLKKIYLIDEAHMLSKASFNALLKILEEPPINALFMLATTDVEKIIDTVRSRCFQLFLRPIDSQDIHHRLTIVAQAEQIPYDSDALWIIAEQANGSVRDALNLVERARSAFPKINVDAVYQVLGKISDQLMKQFLIALYQKNKNTVISLLSSESFSHTTPTVVWRQIFQFLRATWYAKQGIEIDKGIDATIIMELKNICSTEFLGYITSILYKHEIHLLKTNTPRFFIEHLFISIVTRTEALTDEDKYSRISEQKTTTIATKSIADMEKKTPVSNSASSQLLDHENHFLVAIQKIVTPMIYSLFNQAHFIVKQEVLLIVLPQSLAMFEDVLKESEPTWIAILKQFFGSNIKHAYQFTKEIPTLNEKKLIINDSLTPNIETFEKKTLLPRVNKNNNGLYNEPVDKKKKTDFSDATQWPQVNLILKYFPGTTTFIE